MDDVGPGGYLRLLALETGSCHTEHCLIVKTDHQRKPSTCSLFVMTPHVVGVDTFVGDRKRELVFLNVSFNNIEYLPPELGDLVLLK